MYNNILPVAKSLVWFVFIVAWFRYLIFRIRNLEISLRRNRWQLRWAVVKTDHRSWWEVGAAGLVRDADSKFTYYSSFPCRISPITPVETSRYVNYNNILLQYYDFRRCAINRQYTMLQYRVSSGWLHTISIPFFFTLSTAYN